MILTSTDTVAGREIVETLGLVRGNTVRVKHLGKDIIAAFRNLVGGEVSEYTELLSEARSQALARMVKQAEELGANAVVGVRFTTAQVMTAAAEIMAYGTAVKLK
ncbi:MAG TPA: YbjQ family protein [Firmicutes bacterium]|jgi:uncharacterized protein YbjQ (UPF0145 family)|nr:YbjQ family protein [Bacillota bacterium]